MEDYSWKEYVWKQIRKTLGRQELMAALYVKLEIQERELLTPNPGTLERSKNMND